MELDVVADLGQRLSAALDRVRELEAERRPAGPCEHPWETGEGEPAECYECLVARAGRLERERDELLGALRDLSAVVERNAASPPLEHTIDGPIRLRALDVLARFGEWA